MKRFVIALAALAAATAATSAQATAFFDGTFVDTDWTAQKLFDNSNSGSGGASATIGQVGTGGNPGAYRQTVNDWLGTGGFEYGHVSTVAAYNPSIEGAITSMDFSYDARYFGFSGSGANPLAVAYLPFLMQGGSTYQGPYATATQNSWVPFDFMNLMASDFTLTTGSGPANPDFSATGGAIMFGYLTSNGSGFTGTHETTSGIDNWRVEVHNAQVPEPASLSLFGLGLAGLGWARRRRSAHRLPARASR